MRKGFTIIEVLIATAIASLISVALFAALLQTMHYQRTTDAQVDAHTRAALFQNQLEQDFMGFFVPSQSYELASTKTTGTAPKENTEQIDKIFYGTVNKEQFGVLSFITDHAMQVYWGETMGAPKPLVARVVYKLIPSSTVRPEALEGQKNVFTLIRQESVDLDYSHFEGEKSKIRAYDIINDVKSMKVTYLARVYVKEEQKEIKKNPSSASGRTEEKELSSAVRPEAPEGQVKKVPHWTYNEFSEWDWSPKKTQSKDKGKNSDKTKNEKTESKKEQITRIPFYIKVDLVLWDAEHSREFPFTFVFLRKPYEVVELENDTSLFEQKQPQMPSMKPVFDILKMPGMAPAPQVENNQKVKVPHMNNLPKNNLIGGMNFNPGGMNSIFAQKGSNAQSKNNNR